MNSDLAKDVCVVNRVGLAVVVLFGAAVGKYLLIEGLLL